MSTKKTIIWDWNGTLIDDTWVCIDTINEMLEARQLPFLSYDRYLDIFTFPVKDYYEILVFDFGRELWDKTANEFMTSYFKNLHSCKLTKGAQEVLEFFRSQGFSQVIISAMKHDVLVESVNSLGIIDYFEFIGGIGNHYGGGKIENAIEFFSSGDINPSDCIFIGDTLHDAEVADTMKCNCILVAAGHQSRKRLEKSGNTVINDLTEIKTYFNF
jgi:phosphoglycolate phosphatase